MLKITPHLEPDDCRLQLEGKLSGDWVAEFRRAWFAFKREHDVPACKIDLSGVDYADHAGCEALVEVRGEGARLAGLRPFIEELLKEIEHAESR